MLTLSRCHKRVAECAPVFCWVWDVQLEKKIKQIFLPQFEFKAKFDYVVVFFFYCFGGGGGVVTQANNFDGKISVNRSMLLNNIPISGVKYILFIFCSLAEH